MLHHYAWYVWGTRAARLHYWSGAAACAMPALILLATCIAACARSARHHMHTNQNQEQQPQHEHEQSSQPITTASFTHGRPLRTSPLARAAAVAVRSKLLHSLSHVPAAVDTAWPYVREVLTCLTIACVGLLIAADTLLWPGSELPAHASLIHVVCSYRAPSRLAVVLFFTEGLRVRRGGGGGGGGGKTCTRKDVLVYATMPAHGTDLMLCDEVWCVVAGCFCPQLPSHVSSILGSAQ